MPSTVINSVCIAVAVLSGSADARPQESNHPPQFVHDPVLGLRLPIASGKLSPVPEKMRAMCEQMADNANYAGRQWIFGATTYSTTTYYLVNGYSKRRKPRPGEHQYLLSTEGGLYRLAAGQCAGDPARETFEVRDPEQIPHEVLQQLARDLAARLVRATGGADRLRNEIASQRIDFSLLSPEIQEAFQPYFEVPRTGPGGQDSMSAPLFIHDPMLGLRLPSTGVNLDPMPEDVRSMCEQLADTTLWTGRQWIFGRLSRPTVTYYLVDGYFELRAPKPGQRPYFPSYDSGIYAISDGKCSGDEANETVDVRLPTRIPQEIRRELALDLAVRLVRATGGKDRLRTQITNQHIDFHMLPPEIQEAFKPYFAP